METPVRIVSPLSRPGTAWAEREAEEAPWRDALPDFTSKVNVARAYLARRHPFFGRLLLYCDIVPTTHTRTLVTRTDDVIFVNPLWYTQSLDAYERAGALAFASLYLSLTCTERGAGKGALRWAIATTMAIADLVDRCGLTVPTNLKPFLAAMRHNGWESRSDEEIYLRLPAALDNLLVGIRLEDGIGLGLREGAGVGVEGSGKVDDDSSASAGAWGGRLRAAINAANGIGTLPSDLVEAVEASAVQAIPWEALLARLVRGAVSRMRRTGMPNRRKLWPFANVMPAPKVIYPSYKPALPRVDVALDTSGSMYGDATELALGAIGDLFRVLRVPTRLIQCDAAVHDVRRIRSVDSLTIVGRGGTSPDPVFDLIRSEPHAPAVLIYVTDMYMSFDGVAAKPPSFPVIWVDVAGGSALYPPPIGSVVLLRRK